VEEVLVDVGEHAGGGLERVVRRLEADILVAVLVGGVAREDGRDVEDDGGLFVGERVLRRGLVGEGVEPGEADLDVVLVDGEAQVQQLELAVVSVQQITPRGAVLAGAPHVLPQPVQRRAFLRVALGVVAIGRADVALQRGDPVNLARLLHRHRDHGHLCRHAGQSVCGCWGRVVKLSMGPSRCARSRRGHACGHAG
jgi:hypothetical protein